MRVKRLAALLISGVMAVSVLTGCGGVNKEATVATLDGEAVSLGVANFAARLQQASYDDFYVAYFGEEVWTSDMSGDGTTMQDNLKEGVMTAMQTMYTLQKHMGDYGVEITDEEKSSIADAASQFIASNEKDALEALGATQEIVEEYLTLVTIQTKMRAAIILDADTDVSDEEAKTGAYSYVRVSKTTYMDEEGNSVEYTEEQLNELSETLADMAAEAKTDTLETAAESCGYTVSTGTFTQDSETLDAAVLDALKGLEEGEVSDVIDTDANYYVLRLDLETDPDATEQNRQTIIAQRQDDYYNDILSAWEEEHEWVVDEKVWSSVTFDNLFTTVPPSTETESAEDTESVG
ncbi:MAG: peptidyl-prolyl cis-trans isomerase [Roseburia sp.]|nr:peptidyl-prolyl cis-trans isomerase [Roseburia sp.]